LQGNLSESQGQNLAQTVLDGPVIADSSTLQSDINTVTMAVQAMSHNHKSLVDFGFTLTVQVNRAKTEQPSKFT